MQGLMSREERLNGQCEKGRKREAWRNWEHGRKGRERGKNTYDRQWNGGEEMKAEIRGMELMERRERDKKKGRDQWIEGGGNVGYSEK